MNIVRSIFIPYHFYYLLSLYIANSLNKSKKNCKIKVLSSYFFDYSGRIFAFNSKFYYKGLLLCQMEYNQCLFTLWISRFILFDLIFFKVNISSNKDESDIDNFWLTLREEVIENFATSQVSRFFSLDILKLWHLTLPRFSIKDLPYEQDFLAEIDSIINLIASNTENYQILFISDDPIGNYILLSAIANDIAYRNAYLINLFLDFRETEYFRYVFFRSPKSELKNLVIYLYELNELKFEINYPDLSSIASNSYLIITRTLESIKRRLNLPLFATFSNLDVSEQIISFCFDNFDNIYYPKLDLQRLAMFLKKFFNDSIIDMLFSDQEIVTKLSSIKLNFSILISLLRLLRSKHADNDNQIKKKFIKIIDVFVKTYGSVVTDSKRIGFLR